MQFALSHLNENPSLPRRTEGDVCVCVCAGSRAERMPFINLGGVFGIQKPRP